MMKWQHKVAQRTKAGRHSNWFSKLDVIVSRFFVQKEYERVGLLFWVGISKHRCEQNQKVMLILLLDAFCLLFASWLCESWFIFCQVPDYHKFFPLYFSADTLPRSIFPSNRNWWSAWSIKRGATFWIVREECQRPLCDRSGGCYVQDGPGPTSYEWSDGAL